MNPKIKIALAEDHQIMREGLSSIFKEMCELELLYVAKDGQELLNWLTTAESLPEFVLLDINMPHKNGFDTCSEIVSKYPTISILFLTNHVSKKFIETAILGGAKGYLAKDSSIETIKEAIFEVQESGYFINEFLSMDLIQSLLKKGKIKHQFDLNVQLTTREIEVLRGICMELTDAQIAEKLFLSPLTVESYRKSLLRKIGVKKAVGLAIFAVKNNII